MYTTRNKKSRGKALFKENNKHKNQGLFSIKNTLPKNLLREYNKSWSKSFYENVFCQIDETILDILFSKNYSRPNTPVNIYIALEILKEDFGLSDEELLRRFHFDTLFMLAMGIEQIGEATISPRAFYYMRYRIVKYEIETGKKLLDTVFKSINEKYIKKFNIDKKQKRIDSTLIGSNIRRLSRIKLFIEVLRNFLRTLDNKHLRKVVKKIKDYRDIDVENFVYKLSKEDSKIKENEFAEYLYKIKWIFEKDEVIRNTKEYKLVERVVNEHLNIDENKKVELKSYSELKSGSLQSPYDPDATYRKKRGKQSIGYSVTAVETCSKDNNLQLITDVFTDKNNVDDAKILANNFDKICDSGTEEIIADGGYSSSEVREKSKKKGVTVITTAIQGKKIKPNASHFVVKDGKLIRCSHGKIPINQIADDDKITAFFSHESCIDCPFDCKIAKNKKKPNRLVLTKINIEADEQREKFTDREYLRKCRLRPAVEGTMFQLKLHLRNNKSRFRGQVKIHARNVLRAMSINFKRAFAASSRAII